MSRFTEVMDGFVKDENGKFHIRPMKLPEFMTANLSGQKSEQKRTLVRRKFIPIEPLGPLEDFFKSAAQTIESPQPVSKRRKVQENQIRKELFKPPEKKPGRRFTSYGTRASLLSKNPGNSKKPRGSDTKKTKAQNFFDGSPLLDVDEAEKLLKQNKLVTKPVKNVLFPITETTEGNTTVPKNKTPLRVFSASPETTPTSTESMKAELEFLHLEQALASCKKSRKPNVSSPLSSICTLLENTTIQTSEGDSLEKNNVVRNVLLLLKEDQEQWETLQQQFLRYQEEHDKKFNKITELMEQLVENKENASRKSLRIATQSVRTKFVVSPAISQKVDLRRSTLNKNLSKNLETDSPRTRNAVNMYNNIRSDCSVLCTPKLDRTKMEVASTSVTRSLSRRIQKQCLLLQDTPKPHN